MSCKFRQWSRSFVDKCLGDERLGTTMNVIENLLQSLKGADLEEKLVGHTRST